MENNIRFRNHISVIFENVARSIGVMIFIFVGNLISDEEDMSSADMLEGMLFLGLFLLALIVIILIWQIIIWAKTYIIIQENMLIVEKNTLNKKRNTIGLKNVSNVNLEQNVFEMLLGTCKVKLDTNTLTTADQTDVTIVLKKKDAEKFRQMILNRAEKEEIAKEVVVAQTKIAAGMDEILVHGLFSINAFSVIILVVAIIGAAGMLSELSLADVKDDFISVLFTILVMIWIIGGIIWSIVKGFVKYIDFKIERKKDKILLSYGLLKKVAYSIPIDKINAVRLNQTALARIGKYYTVEIINVGLDNEENEENSFFLPYAKKEKIKKQLEMLLPEFCQGLDIKEQKQDKCVWLIDIPGMLLWAAFALLAYGIVLEFVPEVKTVAVIVILAISLLLLISKAAAFLTEGWAIDEKYLKIVEGSFGRRVLFVKYNKIQYVCGRQNFIAKHFKKQKANIFLLAAMKNQIQQMPYFSEEEMEELKSKLIQ